MIRKLLVVFRWEAKRLLSKKYALIILLLLFFALVFTQVGVIRFTNTIKQKDVFQQVEKEKLKQFQNWRQFGSYGFRLIALPAPISIFFTNSVTMHNMTSYLDSGERLRIYQSLKGENVFEMRKKWITDFSGIILFFGGLMALLYGYQSYYRKEYLRFLSSISSSKQLFTFVFLSRSILLFLLLAFITACAHLLILLNGIPVPISKYLLISFFEGYLTLLFFYAIGTVFSSFKSKIVGVFLGLTACLLSLFIIPTGVDLFIAYKGKSITPVYKLEIEKLKILMGFEKQLQKKAGILKLGEEPNEIFKQEILSYWKNEFRKIQALEEEMMARMQENTSLFHKISAFFPTTFYLALNNEISSRGYESLMDFYEYVLKMKRDFFKTYIDNVYFSNYSKIESFFKEGNENIFQSRPRLPGHLLLGFAVNLFYIAILTFLSYALFKKSLFRLRMPKKEKKIEKPNDLVLESGQFKSWKVFGHLLNDQLFNLLSNQIKEMNKKAYPLNLSINNGNDLNKTGKRQNFLSLCHPQKMPGDVRIKELITLAAGLMKVSAEKKKEILDQHQLNAIRHRQFKKLDLDELGRVCLAILDMKLFDIYLVNNITREMTMDFALQLKDRLKALSQQNALVLLLHTDSIPMVKNMKSGVYFKESYKWLESLESCRNFEEQKRKRKKSDLNEKSKKDKR